MAERIIKDSVVVGYLEKMFYNSGTSTKASTLEYPGKTVIYISAYLLKLVPISNHTNSI